MVSMHPLVLTLSSVLLAIVRVQSALGDSRRITDDRPEGSIIISQYASDIILNKGENYTFYCKSNRSINFKQQIIPEDNFGPFRTELEPLDSDDQEYDYSVAFHLYNIDEFAVGYYACFDDTVDSDSVLTFIVEEPTNTEHIVYTYVYVDGTGNLFAPINDFVQVKANSEFIIGCRTNTPDVNVALLSDNGDELSERFNSKIGFLVDEVNLSEAPNLVYCIAHYGGEIQTKEVVIMKHSSTEPRPQVFSEHADFLGGETFTLNCTIDYQTTMAIMLTWITPNEWRTNTAAENEVSKHIITNEHSVVSGKLYKTLIVSNAGPQDAGVYTCLSTTSFGNKTANVTKNYLEHGYVEMIRGTQKNPIEAKGLRSITLHATIHAYPPPNITVLKDSKEIVIENSKKYRKTENLRKGIFSLKIASLTVNDTANYTVIATNEGASATENFDLRIQSPPNIDLGSFGDWYALLNTTKSFRCDVVGYPLPTVTWSFKNNQDGSVSETRGQEIKKSIYMVTSILEMPALHVGEVSCTASNPLNTKTDSRQLKIYEISGGFGILNGEDTWLAESQKTSFKCYASIYNYKNVTWFHDTNDLSEYVSYYETDLSMVAVLNFESVKLSQEGNYTCTAFDSLDLGETNQTIQLTVTAISDPVVMEPEMDGDLEVYPYQPVSLTCLADAIPKPEIHWYKDGIVLNPDDKIDIFTNYLNHSTVNSTVSIIQSLDENKGVYECVVSNNLKSSNRFINLILKEKSSFRAEYLGIIGLIFLLLLLVVIYLILRVRKEKAFRKELAAAGLLNFKEGATASINPELGIDDQAELLPYDEKFEFSPEKLKLEKQLGAGAFGVVYKGLARGILNAEETTIVAVKMVKKTADNMYIKALASELKIMVHLGKHINIVNLLGACTKNVGKRELLVIVEYCKYGNIHNYLQRHREVFINQLTDGKEKSFGRVNRGFSSSSNNSGSHSDYFGSNHTQDTDNTCLNSINTNRSSRKVSESSYLPPEWRSNYESDYSYDSRSPRPLCSRDLLCWAFQIARGMEYLANRKVLHGDLAARNILLAEDNVVKICDFGLAKSIYKNDEYQKKENSPLPVKWLALECMTDRIFSTQSDVWSFGIVLWEIFSLAKTPYPGLSPQSLLPWLSDGKRLDKPSYADERLYEVMLQCWHHKPTSRPTFTQLQDTLGSFLDDHVKKYYVDLNATYMDVNAKRDVEDYLDMMCAPDYNNLVAPNPHHYINDPTMNYFPPPSTLQHDEDGYLQMSPSNQPFNARPQAPRFDYDARKLNARSGTPEQYQHELTPMLTLNNLPARSGSDSDHEGSTSPYLKMCPRIEEEKDEVFENNSKNAKNLSHIKAISNPTYISFDLDKKKDICYVNVGPNNGLVK